jgi:membrane protein
MGPKQIWRLLKETVKEWGEDKSSRLAAALAYYTVFSLAPLLILVIAIAGLLFDQAAVREQIVQQIQSLVGEDGASIISTALDNANRPGQNSGIIATIISIAVLLFGASGVFAQLQDAMNTVWDVEAAPNNAATGFIRKRILSFAMVLSIGFLLIVSLVISAALSAAAAFLSGALPGFDLLWQLLNIVLSLVVLTVLFAMLFKFVPDVRIAWKDVWFGGFITALLFTIGKYLLGLYLGRSSVGSAYGAAGSLVVLLAWIYYSAQILFFGAEFTQVYARRYGSRIEPDDHAIPLDPETRAKQGMSRRQYLENRQDN